MYLGIYFLTFYTCRYFCIFLNFCRFSCFVSTSLSPSLTPIFYRSFNLDFVYFQTSKLESFLCQNDFNSISTIFIKFHIFGECLNIVKEIKHYQEKWLQHVQRMDTNRIPKEALQYKSKGRRNIGRPRKRWRDQLHLEDQETGNTPNLS